jgi:hypothetical protein
VRQPTRFKKGFMKIDMYDALVIFLCLILTLMFGVFFGSEIETIKHDAEIRLANRKIQNCNYIITKGSLYEVQH